VIEMPVEVGDGATLIRTAVRAESLLRAGLLRAVEAARAYYHGASIQVVYPIDLRGSLSGTLSTRQKGCSG